MSQSARILRVLADGEWHTASQLLAVVSCVVHSRVADLRAQGHVIEYGSTGRGAAGSRYRLVAQDEPPTVVLRREWSDDPAFPLFESHPEPRGAYSREAE